ncbi:hypothetical protein ACQP1V_06450 [Microtetraspora malaysiensis]|uniref:hypothetical protein n=1 Tax=Microtetraspora malaysiensis TaxID=161358 RepID=UPI003D8E9C95
MEKPSGTPRDVWWWLWVVAPPIPAAVLTLLDATFPGGSLLRLLTVAAWVFAFFAWVVVLALSGIRTRVALLVTPVVAATTWGLAATEIPFRGAFALSEAALTSFVKSLPIEPEEKPSDTEGSASFRLVGLYIVGGWSRRAGAAHIGVVGGGGVLEQCGLTYLTGDRIEDYDYSSVRPLHGGWYAVCSAD